MKNQAQIWKQAEKQFIKKLIANDKQNEASQALYNLIEEAVKQRRFNEAEKLREQIIDINPMALSLIIQAAELIEDAKKSSIDKKHFEIWQPLIYELSLEDFSSLYHHMIRKKYSNKSMIVKQGDFLRVLFFINHGSVQLFTEADGQKVGLKMMGPGNIFGGESFFDPSVWTASARSNGADVFALPYKKLQAMSDSCPALESKLNDYCAQFKSPDIQLQSSKRGRRQFIRNILSGRTIIELLDKKGAGTGKGVKGELCDISKGGVSCSLYISKKVNAFKMFGQKIRTLFSSDCQAKSIVRTGVIVAVRGYHVVQNEYSLHVKFDDLLTDMEMQNIVSAAKV